MASPKKIKIWHGLSTFKFLISIPFLWNWVSLAESNPSCRHLPGDAAWPSLLEWRNLNSSVNGKLVATVPLGAPCHDPVYNEGACKRLQMNWLEPEQQSERFT